MRKIKNNKLYQVMVFLLLMVTLIIGYFYAMKLIDRQLHTKEQTFSWVYQVDEMRQEEGKLILTGWAFELKKDAQGDNYEVVLRDIKTGKYYFPKMDYGSRADVNDYFLCEYDYTKSGFTAVIPIKKLDLDDAVYEVMLRPKEEKNAYSINVYYAENKMQFINPEEFIAPEVEGTDLEQIVEQGILRVYGEEYPTYVYQYNKALYWIVDKADTLFTPNYIQFQMDTTQISKLPQVRIDHGWGWGNISFKFENNELLGKNTGKYRVTKCAIPTEHSVTKIWTYIYKDNKYTWTYFYPWYDFAF